MADINILSRLVNGVQRNVDLQQNSLVVGSLKVGATSPTELTKAILDNLVSLQNGSDISASLHHHDGRYFTETELGSSSASSGSDLIGDDNTYSNFTPAAATVKGALSGIDTALANVADEKVGISAADTTPGYLAAKITVDNGTNSTNPLEESILNPGANEELRIRFDQSKVDHGSIGGLGDDDHTQYILVAGTRAFSGNQSMGGFKLTNLGAPTQNGDALRYDMLGANNGIATLDGSGKVPVSQLPSAIMTYEGVWNASTNSPTLADGAGDVGMVYRVSVAGTQNLGSGNISFDVGDYVILNSSLVWEKSDTTDSVVSVNGQTGVVSLDTDDIAEGSALYFTDERAQDAIGTILLDSATIDLTYDDGTPSISASVKTNSIDETHLTASVAGAGLSGGNGSALAVNVDDSTIEINTDTLRVKDLGIGTAKLGATSVTAAKLGNDVAGTGLSGGNGSALSVAFSPLMQKAMIAGESFAANTSFLVRMARQGETAGRIYKADNDATSNDNFYVVGIALSTSAVSAGGSINVIMLGTHTLGSSDSAFLAADLGKPVYLTASGAFSVTAPSAANTAVVRVGVVEDTNKIMVSSMQLNGIN